MAELEIERESWAHLRAQSFGLVSPSDKWLRLSGEIRAIMESLGQLPKGQECIF